MKLRYRTAIIGFCPDLTDPDASSIPVASLLVGDATNDRLGAAVVVIPPDGELKLDELSRAMLADVPALLRRHVADVMASLPADAPSENILYSLHDGLRNSLQVLEIGEENTLDLEDAKFPQAIYDLGIDVLRKALAGIGVDLIPFPGPAPTVRPQSFSRAGGTKKTVRALPQTTVWPLREDGFAYA
jgi:hypothetical protein